MREPAEVVSGPTRKMSMASEQKADVEKELTEIRKEVIEARNLVIKTDNVLKNLHAEVKAVSKRHEDWQRKQWISSGVAYALFAILAVGAATPRPVVIDGEVAAATVMTVTLSADHRVLDGAVAARWLAAFTALVEHPLRLLL